MLVDTHTHIYDNAFANDLAQVVERARAAGVQRMLLPNEDASTVAALQRVCATYSDCCYAMAGVHPTSVRNDCFQSEVDAFEASLAMLHPVAIGEIGLDLYWTRDSRDAQKKMFEYLVDRALQLDLPIAIHARDAFAETLDSLRKFDARRLRGVFHAFSGGIDAFREISRVGDFYVGIGGTLTFKNAKYGTGLALLPMDRIVLETDAPYLSPVPYRGKRNEPAYVALVAAKLAEVCNTTFEKVALQTSCNAKNLFFFEGELKYYN